MKTPLILTMLAVATIATALPTASACYATNEVVRYVVCDGSGARDDAAAAVAFAQEEAGDVLEFVQGTELWQLLP